MKNYFNPRSYKRSDESASHFWHKVIISIHAPTRGATQFLWMHLLVHLFQSTLLQEERPQDNMVMQIGKMISIHAPTRGATCQPYTPSHSCLISIHAPTRGATTHLLTVRDHLLISIHAPTRGATSLSKLCFIYSPISIHAPTRGATRQSRLLSFFS